MIFIVCVSYGGELVDLQVLFGYVMLCQICEVYGVQLFEVVMSLIGMVNVGKGVVMVGFVDELYIFCV